MIWFLFLAFLLLAIIRLPVALALGIAVSATIILFLDLPLAAIPHKMVNGIDSYIFLAIPLFLLAGRLMNKGGITDRIFGFARVLVGHISGGLAHANIVAGIIFSWMSGSAVAAVGGLGEIELKAMKENGFDKPFASSVIVASSVLGPIIPPSIPLIIYAAMTETSVGKLFLGGIIPGLMIALALMILIYTMSKQRNYPKDDRASFSEILSSFRESILPLLMPLIMLGGIASGIFTPTEAAAVAAFYALFLGLFVYKTVQMSQLPLIFVETMVTTAVVTFIISTTAPFSLLLTLNNTGELLSSALLGFTENKLLVLLLINILLLIFGAIMEAGVVLILFTPILFPLALSYGIDPIHFGIIMIVNLMIGVATPPMGVCLFVMSHISGLKVEVLMKAILPFLFPMIIVLLIVTYFPDLVLLVPNIFMK